MEGREGSRRRSSSRLSLFTGSSLSLTVKFTRDVFVACADKDEAEVKSRVIQPLESREVTCCYAQRDFIPGHSESESVVEAMETSRRTIVVLSKNFKHYRLSHTVLSLSNQLISQGRVIPVKIDEDTDMDGRFRDVVISDMTAIDETTFISRLEKAVTMPLESGSLMGAAASMGSLVGAAAPSDPYTPESTTPSEISSDSSAGNTELPQEWGGDEFRHDHSAVIVNAEDEVAQFNDLDTNDPYYKHMEGHHLKELTKTTSLHKLAHFSCSKSQVVADKALEKLQDLVSSRMGHCDPDTYLDELQKAEVILRETINRKRQTVIIKRRMLRLKTYALIVYQLGILLDKGDIDLENKFFAAVNDFSKMIDSKAYMNKGLVASYTVQFAQSAAKYTQDISKRKGSSFTYVEKLVHLVECQTEGKYKELLKSLCDITTDKKKQLSTEVFLHILKKKVMRVTDASTIFLDVLQKVLDAILKNKNKKMEKVCRSGLLLVGTQILVYIASYHANPGIRVQAVKGSYTNDMAGLCQLWEYEDKKWKDEVASEVSDLCTPLCFRSEDEAVVRAVADRFLTVKTSSSREQSIEEIPYQNDPQLDQTKMLPVMLKNIKHRLYAEGQIFTVPAESQTSSGSALSIYGRMSETDVLIKVTRHSTREDLVSKELASDGLRNEIRILRRMNHPHVISVLAAHDGPSPPYYLITPRMQEETLIDYVIGLRKAVPTDVIVALVDACRQISEAVIYLSTKAKVVHRDIMAENCLCRALPNGRMHCCLTNFELSRTMKRCGSEASQYECPGNPKDPIAYRWSAPESLTQDIFTSASEVWMLACLIYEVLTLGVHPFPECEDPRRMKDYLNGGNRTEQPSCLSKLDEKNRMYQFLWMCWSTKPADRPSPENVREFLEKTARRHSKGDFSHVFVSPPTLRGESIVRRSIISQANEKNSSFCSKQITDDALSISQPLYYDPVAPDVPTSAPCQPPRPGSPLSDTDSYCDTVQQSRVQTTDQDGSPVINQPMYYSPVVPDFPVRTQSQPPRPGSPAGDDYDDTIQQTCGYQELHVETSQYQTLGTPAAGAQAPASQASRAERSATHSQPGITASAVHLRQGARPRPFQARAPSAEEIQPRIRLQTEPTRPNPRVPDPRAVQSEIFYI